MDEIRVENSQNVIAGSTVSANGDVLVGGQKITNYFYSAPYEDLKNQWDKWQTEFAETQRMAEKFPDEEYFKTQLLRIDEESNAVQKKIDDLKNEIMRLAETFSKIPVNTQRLRLARQHFEAGEYGVARIILDAGEMGSELDALLSQKQQLQHRQTENEANLLDKANEFLILARLTAVDYTFADRYDKTVEYFEQSLKAVHTVDNTFEYAYFLQQHNQLVAAVPFYTEAIEIYRRLAKTSPQIYLPYVAVTLNNLANVQKARDEFPAAEAAYQEAQELYRHLAEANPRTYMPGVAGTLNNLADLRCARNEFLAAEAGYREALAIRRRLAQINPQTYLPEVAGTLNNLANMQQTTKEFPAAAAGYQEALAIRRRLAQAHPKIYLLDVAMTAVNISMLYLLAMPDREKSLRYATETVMAALPFMKLVPASREYAAMAMNVAQAWGLDRKSFFEEAVKGLQSDEADEGWPSSRLSYAHFLPSLIAYI
jgi:hypothetical protein